jgi:hypothetical protein
MNGSPESVPKQASARRDAERRASRRVLVPAFAISVLVHAAAFLLIRFDTDTDRVVSRPPVPSLVNVEPVMRAYDVAVVAAGAAPVEAQLEERRAVREAAADRAWGPEPDVAAEAPPRGQSAASVQDRLRYRMGSGEVWRPQAPLPADELSPDDVVRARVAAQLQQFNDSVAAEGAAAARATDWTVKDGNGGRWGVSPGSLHLGNVTVPLPFALSTPPGRREEVAGRIRSWTEIQDQAARAEGRQIFDDRVRAIRERADQERAAGTPASTTAAPPAGGGSGGGG